MKSVKFAVIFWCCVALYGVDDNNIIVKNLNQMSPAEFNQVRQIAHRAGINFSYMLESNLDLLVMISQKNNEIQQIIIGDHGNGQIFYISDGRGFIVQRIDFQLISAVEQACKQSGAESVHALCDWRTRCLRACSGYLIEPARGNECRFVKRFQK